MIPAPPSGWTQRFGANLVVYEAPDGASRIRCYQGMPLEPISRVVARVAGPASIEATSAIVNAEGEYGALCRVGGDRIVGVLFADANALVIEASAQHAELVRDLLARWKLELGVRPRRVLYAPPVGWQPMPNALVTTWFPPGFPDDHAELVVYPAAATTSTPRDELARLIAVEGTRVIGEIRELPITTFQGLVGTHATMEIAARAGIVQRELVLLWRAPFRYGLKLEWIGAPRYRDVLLDVVHSVRPLPVAAPGAAAGSMGHWSD